ncbi:MAG: AAA family ATPase [Oscillatoriales cyanobacterium]|uniref:AAA family ATPase n=1 Tax=unclassified Microcoleus TaxID=2642155 RepID=UPI001DC79B01|nr:MULTISPECIES: AAA family ATPase [unclassified Microcoleus]TAF00884.1 MAG: AAA family ATPase [Oscillatoriales cyanobacterium]MCC3459775.1 AAA family ATPase [Microcoleus sp. PH2017_11_PCY_U_A]MCC3478208.1 AAA family ATPase [Microcoleus sp. PH2017_12_PCY_D_A]TAF21358.1 MAG: AAA family ATPase [Oscillatoriales cyanobacterium]TAF39715.1 MAG: AAA family ATPase [Oscillatoriales cyanobacterium]
MLEEINLMLSARFPLLWVVSPEEETAEETLCAAAIAKKAQIYFWDFARGWNDSNTAKGNPMQALERVIKAAPETAAIFVMKDIVTLIAPGSNGQIAANQLPIVREIKNLAREVSRDRRTLVILSDQLRLPVELREETTVVDFSLPTIEEISELVDRLVGAKIKLVGESREHLLKACQGLSRCRISRVLAKCLARSGKVDETSIDAVIEEKKQTIRETGILEFIPAQVGLESVGGLENLKQWVKMRSHNFSDKAREYGLPSPKGVLLAGIQGTGKSLSAKTIAAEWKLPLLRLDVGRLFGGVVGESEGNVRQVIKLASAIAPCVLFIDEADKAFANITSGNDGDSGTSQRVFGTLLTWMQEKTVPVFVVLTCNRTEVLPAELIRKGRIDELFFVGLPSSIEREQIFSVHFERLRGSAVGHFDMEKLAIAAKDFSGAEIEQAIYEAMQNAFSRNEAFTQADILTAIHYCVPLAKIAQPQIEALKSWAVRSGAKSASFQEISKSKNGASLLVVD